MRTQLRAARLVPVGYPPCEVADGETPMMAANDLAIRRTLEMAGVEFIDENGGGAGVRLRKPHQAPKRK